MNLLTQPLQVVALKSVCPAVCGVFLQGMRKHAVLHRAHSDRQEQDSWLMGLSRCPQVPGHSSSGQPSFELENLHTQPSCPLKRVHTHQRLLVQPSSLKQVALLTVPSPLAIAVPPMQQIVSMVASSVPLPTQSPVPAEAVRATVKVVGNCPLAGGLHITVTVPEVLTAHIDTASKQSSRGSSALLAWPQTKSCVLLAVVNGLLLQHAESGECACFANTTTHGQTPCLLLREQHTSRGCGCSPEDAEGSQVTPEPVVGVAVMVVGTEVVIVYVRLVEAATAQMG